MEHLYFDLGDLAGGTHLEVSLMGSAANVFLVSAEDYQAYCDGEDYTYYGGFWDVTPFVLQVPFDDYWYLVVDGNEYRVKVTVTELDD